MVRDPGNQECTWLILPGILYVTNARITKALTYSSCPVDVILALLVPHALPTRFVTKPVRLILVPSVFPFLVFVFRMFLNLMQCLLSCLFKRLTTVSLRLYLLEGRDSTRLISSDGRGDIFILRCYPPLPLP